MLINKTLLGKAPFSISLAVVSMFLAFLFTMIKPEVSLGLSFFPRLIFWALQVATGLLGIVAASITIRRLANRDFPMWIALTITGVLGALIASPFFVLIDGWFPGLVDEPDSWLDRFELGGPFHAVIAEFIDVFPVLLATWFVVNLPLLLNTTFLNTPPSDEPPPPDDNASIERQRTRDKFYSRLPTVIGDNVISISSDLHYLNVTTTLGNSLILGSLTQITDALEDDGFLVHRSHWVHKDHVTKVHVAGNIAYCLMSNKEQIPISRSKRKLVKEYFGQSQFTQKHKKQVELKQVK